MKGAGSALAHAPTALARPQPDRDLWYRGNHSTFGDRLLECLLRNGARTSLVRLTRNDVVYSCGQTDNNVFLILSGLVKTSTIAACGKECLVDMFTGRDLIGEACLLTSERLETATAMAPTVVRRIARGHFLDVLAAEGLLEECLRYLTGRLFERQQMITQLVTADSEKRLAAILLWLAGKLGIRRGHTIVVEHRITQAELSEMVGTTRSRIGHFLKKFRNLGLINHNPDATLVIHEERLHAYLDQT